MHFNHSYQIRLCKMFDLVISRHGITHGFTALGPTWLAAPPIWLVLWETVCKILYVISNFLS